MTPFRNQLNVKPPTANSVQYREIWNNLISVEKKIKKAAPASFCTTPGLCQQSAQGNIWSQRGRLQNILPQMQEVFLVWVGVGGFCPMPLIGTVTNWIDIFDKSAEPGNNKKQTPKLNPNHVFYIKLAEIQKQFGYTILENTSIHG